MIIIADFLEVLQEMQTKLLRRFFLVHLLTILLLDVLIMIMESIAVVTTIMVIVVAITMKMDTSAIVIKIDLCFKKKALETENSRAFLLLNS